MKLKLSRQAYEETYRQQYLKNRVELLENSKRALREQNRNHDYYVFWNDIKKNRQEDLDSESRIVLWFYELLANRYQEFSLENRRIFTLNTAGGGNIGYAKRVFELNGASFIEKIVDADTGLYWGQAFCYYKRGFDIETGFPAIWDLLEVAEKREFPLILFYEGSYVSRHCQDDPETKKIKELEQKRKTVLHFPLNYPYPLTTNSGFSRMY